jgi:hypothetical protein
MGTVVNISKIGLTNFAIDRHFRGGANPSGIILNAFSDHTPQSFVARMKAGERDTVQYADGYAPFCKHVFIPNFLDVYPAYIPITDKVRPLIETGYKTRRADELPVLSRWVRSNRFVRKAWDVTWPAYATDNILEIPPLFEAKWLDIIVYSRIQLEYEAGKRGELCSLLPDYNWGIVGVIPLMTPVEVPMPPATMVRNALGPAEGGSGIPLDRIKYRESVEYHSTHVAVDTVYPGNDSA